MLLRSLRLPLRAFSSAPSASAAGRQVLTRNDVDFISNPKGKYMDAFMKNHGDDRAVFKRNDTELWQKSFGDDYMFRVMALKGTDNVIACCHSCKFEPLDASNEPMFFIGLGWIEPEVRKLRVAALLSDMVKEGILSSASNINSNVNTALNRFWYMLCGKKDTDKTGTEALNVGYNSFYDYKDVFVPKDLNFDGITVKSVKDVPRADLISYDQKIHPYHREEYLIGHMNDNDGFGKAAYDDKGQVIGMAQAVIYPKGDCNLGPVYGDNPRVVQAMFAEILKDIEASGRTVKSFEVRSIDAGTDSSTWIKPFLKCELVKEEVCRLFYHNWNPVGMDFSKVYAPTHAQLFLI